LPANRVHAEAGGLKMRSLLFVPGDSERKLGKASRAGADALILDLEDGVGPERKAEGRKLVREYLGRPRQQRIFVRVNALTSGLLLEDLTAILAGAPDGVVLPKCADGHDLETLGCYLSALEVREAKPEGSTKILAIVAETAQSILGLNQGSFRHPRLEGLMWGAEDLAADVGASSNRALDGSYAAPFTLARSLCLFAAAAAGVLPIDSVFLRFDDPEGLTAEARAGRTMGFAAKAAIHPNQVEIINRCFLPSDEELAWARRVVQIFSEGLAVSSLNGQMLDRPHLLRARRLLASVGEDH
jgi:citrate lyase subunit beta / citryl-CoA lyase